MSPRPRPPPISPPGRRAFFDKFCTGCHNATDRTGRFPFTRRTPTSLLRVGVKWALGGR